MSTSFQDSPVPRYFQLANLFRQRIERGLWPDGHRLPTLEELMAEFSVARVTVRQAIELLAREGLVSPQQGRGTFVTGRPQRDRFISVVTTLDELVRSYENIVPTVVTVEKTVDSLPLTAGESHLTAPSYTYLRRMHSRDGAPYCVINLYLDERVFKRSPKAFRTHTVVPILRKMKGVQITAAHQVLTINTADMEVAQMLGLTMGAPVMEVRRIFKGADGAVLYLADVTYRGDAVRIEMDLQP